MYSFLGVHSVIFPVVIFDIRLVKRHIFPSAWIQCDAPRTGRFCAFKLLRTSCLLNQIIKCCVCLLLTGSGWQRPQTALQQQVSTPRRFPACSLSRLSEHSRQKSLSPITALSPPASAGIRQWQITGWQVTAGDTRAAAALTAFPGTCRRDDLLFQGNRAT